MLLAAASTVAAGPAVVLKKIKGKSKQVFLKYLYLASTVVAFMNWKNPGRDHFLLCPKAFHVCIKL